MIQYTWYFVRPVLPIQLYNYICQYYIIHKPYLTDSLIFEKYHRLNNNLLPRTIKMFIYLKMNY